MLIWKYNRNRRRRNAYEAKQVGVLYHVCSADDLMNHIKPEDTLSTSGTYTNFLYGGNDWVSFTRNRHYVVKKNGEWNNQDIYIQFEVDGDLLSENHKVKPYNDMVYDLKKQNGEFDTTVPYTGYNLESEECVKGEIKQFSKFVKGIVFTISSNSMFYDAGVILEHAKALAEYARKCGVTPVMSRDIEPNKMGGLRFIRWNVNSLEELIRITWIVSLVTHTLWDNVRLETHLKSVNCFALSYVEPILHESLEFQPTKTKEKKVRNAFIQSFWNIAKEYSDRCSISCETNDGTQVDIRTATALKRLMTNVTKSLEAMPSYSRPNPKFTLYDDKTSCSILRVGDYVIKVNFK